VPTTASASASTNSTLAESIQCRSSMITTVLVSCGPERGNSSQNRAVVLFWPLDRAWGQVMRIRKSEEFQ